MARRYFAPEVIQTSAMDCGPAALKCLLDGHGIPVSYGRLREACQTDVDGTSIDTLEDVANQLGLPCEQIMVPVDHVLLSEGQSLPAIAVVSQPNGTTHFVVVWRKSGGLVQVMDPGTGRAYRAAAGLLDELYIHHLPVGSGAFRDWAKSEEFTAPLRRRMAVLGIGGSQASRLLGAACAEPSWRAIASLDAAVRMTTTVVQAGGLMPGREALVAVERFAHDAVAEPKSIPFGYWTALSAADWAGEEGAPPVEPVQAGEGEGEEPVEERLLLCGAVLVRVLGKAAVAAQAAASADPSAEGAAPRAPLSPELAAALEEPRSRPGLALLRLLRADGLLSPLALCFAMALAAGGVVVEALLLRGLFDLVRDLALPEQRLVGIGALIVFVTALMFLEWPIASGLLRLGRQLESRLRIAFLSKIPRLGDRYFQSRLTSDMAERGHSVHNLRQLPQLGSQFLRTVFALGFTTLGIAWLDPTAAPLAMLVAALAVVLPLLAQAPLVERDLRQRSHAGALSRYYLDAMLGLVAVRTHGAERSLRRGHEGLLVEWARTGRALQRTVLWVEGVLAFAGFGLAAWLLLSHLGRSGFGGGALLLVYWALSLPAYGEQLALATRQYPALRNTALRLTEPLGAPEEPWSAVGAQAQPGDGPGLSIELRAATVRAGGHVLLEDVDLHIESGAEVAIVGPSGAGKSTLVGILLGWQRLSGGEVLVDGEPLDAARVERLRRECAWVDPAVQLWNRSFLDNLRYGSPPSASERMGSVIESADLHGVLERLPDGLQTPLGEGGALVSGGEGQRVRLGRSLLRPGVRLVILDEPFRGLDREKRRLLLQRARAQWKGATLLCITHDVGETTSFERVLVVEGGRIAEDDAPSVLAARAGSRYRALLDAEDAVQRGLWASSEWRRLYIDGGHLRPEAR